MKNFLNKYIKKSNKETVVFLSIIAFAIICSVISFIYYYNNGLYLAYGDAKAHLNIARRVLFSLTPGATQLGGIWLPLPHILFLPTVWNDFMYYSGLSGTIVSMISFIVIVITIFKAVYFYTRSLLGSIIGALVVMLSPSLLYFQTTPMTEPLSIATALVAIYLIIKWSRSNNLITLILAAFLAAIATLCRYDNWFIVVTSSLVVALVGYIRNRKLKQAESSLFIFSSLACFGIFLWLLWNLVIFGNPLNFALGEGSASWFATSQNATTKHHLYLSLITFMWLMIENIGVLTLVLLNIGVIVYLLRYRFKRESLPGYLFLAPIVFNLLALYLGQSIAFTQHLPPHLLYNTRYGLNALPAAAFFIGITTAKFKKSIFLLVPIVGLQYYLLFTSPLTIIQDATKVQRPSEHAAAEWIKNHPVEGLVLVSTGTFDTLTFQSRIPEEKIIYEGSGKILKDTLKNPTKYATRIITGRNVIGSDTDPIGKIVLKSPEINTHYHVVFSNLFVTVYDRNLKGSWPEIKSKDQLTKTTELVKYEYLVKAGDNLWKIAEEKSGDPKNWQKLVEINNIQNPRLIHPGQVLNLNI
ncbi:MAG: LysM peptidoglycan-binding domain-containing protein [Patescibacteria group bacterium]|nr:LysM peptidoglycan-binding domain-containing protein [Patescibacteria group bacterium]